MTFDAAISLEGFSTWLGGMLGAATPPASTTCGPNCTLAGVAGCDGVLGSGALEDRCGVCSGGGASCTAPALPSDYAPMCAATPGSLSGGGGGGGGGPVAKTADGPTTHPLLLLLAGATLLAAAVIPTSREF